MTSSRTESAALLVGCQYSIRIWESGEWQTRTAEAGRGWDGWGADPLFVPLTTRGADPRSESYRYGWSSWAPQVGNSTILVRALEGDVNYDCRVNIIDEQSEAGRYGSSLGTWQYHVLFDLDPLIPDSDIGIKDLQFVFGRDGSTCESPIPSQPAERSAPTPAITPTPSFTPTATAPSGGSVGGIQALPDRGAAAPATAESSHGSSPLPYGALACVAAGGVIILGARGWYARRRWRAG